jgi:hypothetical protein
MANAIPPIQTRLDAVGGTLMYWGTHRADRMMTANMMGISSNSAVLIPTIGTINSTRIVPRTNPAPKTSAK